MATDWYPRILADRIPWHANYSVQATATGTTYGLAAGDVTDIGRDKDNVPLVVNYKEAAQAYAQAVTEWAEAILNGPVGTTMPAAPTAPTAPTFALGSKPGIQARTRQTAGVIKADADFTAEIGELYGIVAPVGTGPATPSLKARALPGTGSVELSIAKGGFDVIVLDMRRGGGAWDQLGVSQRAVFTDTTPPLTPGQPEVREYRAQGMLDNARTGDLSATVSAVTVP